MSLCTICGRNSCAHTPEERGQTFAEMMRKLTLDETEFWLKHKEGDPEVIKMAQKNAHLVV